VIDIVEIVRPDATPEEIRAAVNDEQGGQVFAQAVSQRFMGYDMAHER